MDYGQRIIVPALEQPWDCQGCILHGVSTGFATAEGTGSNGVICIAERLGEHEVLDGLPLRPQGAAGSIFERIIKQLGLSRSQFKILNVINCLIPAKELKGTHYEFPAIEHCRTHRDHVMLNMPDTAVSYRKKVILAMGDIATRTLTGMGGYGEGIDKLRGYPVETPYGLVLPTYNPAKIYHESKLMGVLKYDIQHAVNIAQFGWALPDTRYQEHPTVEEAWAFYRLAKSCTEVPNDKFGQFIITCDIENEFDRQQHWVRLASVQFSLAKNEGIFLPATWEYLPVIKAILALKAQFWFHNGWRHDQPILTQDEYYSEGRKWQVVDAIKATFGGPVHDSLWAFHHAQPDLTTQESEDGLGISSKMGLQYVASLYGFPRRWKQMSKINPEYYGICDVDALQYIVPPLIDQLKAKGMWESYLTHVQRYDPILVRITERGIPVSEGRRLEVKQELGEQLDKVELEIQQLYPHDLKNIDPKAGYTRPPTVKEGKIRWEPYDPCGATVALGPVKPGHGFGDYQWFDEDDKAWRTMELRLFTGLKIKKKVDCDCFSLLTHSVKGKELKKPKKVYNPGCPNCAGKKKYTILLTEERRWVKVLPFRPSKDQILKYIKFRKHKVPTKRGADSRRVATTDYKELEKLAVRTGDPLYKKIVEYRKFEKLISTYIDAWAPQADGAVHSVFLGSTATGQLASEAPNALNPPKHNEVLANKFRSMIIAPAGHTFIEMDYKSYHGATLAAESGDEVYYKIAVQAGDAHSFLASYMVKEPIDPTLPLGELIPKLEYIKKKYKQVRNTKAKPANLGYGFGMQGPGLYERNQESFEMQNCKAHPNKPCGEACNLISMLNDLYHGNYVWRETQVLEAFKNGGKNGSGYLLSKFRHIRWFHNIYSYRRLGCVHCNGKEGYNYKCWICQGKGFYWTRKNGSDVEDMYAFKPANHAHCNFREVQIRLDDRGLLEQYQLILPYHDALYFVCRDEWVEEAIYTVREEMIKPIKVLAHPTLCPDGLVVDVDVNIGKSWDRMSGYKIVA